MCQPLCQTDNKDFNAFVILSHVVESTLKSYYSNNITAKIGNRKVFIIETRNAHDACIHIWFIECKFKKIKCVKRIFQNVENSK